MPRSRWRRTRRACSFHALATLSGSPTGRTLVEPSDMWTPVPATASCMTFLAWSAAGAPSTGRRRRYRGMPSSRRSRSAEADAALARVMNWATGARPSAPRIACGVSTCTSKRMRPAGSPFALSRALATATIASTWSTDVTLGRVRVRPSAGRRTRRVHCRTCRACAVRAHGWPLRGT